MPDIRELGRKVKQKYPGQYDDLADDDLGRRVKAKHPGAYDDFTDTPRRSASMDLLGYEQSTSDPYGDRRPSSYIRPGRGAAANFLTGMQQEGAGAIAPAALSGFEALGSAMVGDFGPAKEIGELALRGAGRLVMGGQPSLASSFVANEQAIERLHAERAARRRGDPIFESVAQTQRELDLEAGQDPSLPGRIARGAGRVTAAAAPSVGVGIASGGSIPAMAAVGALQSLDRPENLPLNVGLGVAPIPVGKAVAPLVRRFRGAGSGRRTTAPQVVRDTSRIPAVTQADAPPTAQFPNVRTTPEYTRQIEDALTAGLPDYPSSRLPELASAELDLGVRAGRSYPRKPGAVGPAADPVMALDAGEAEAALTRLGQAGGLREYGRELKQLARQSPREAAKVVGREIIATPRAILSSGDLSAPLRQGAILSLSPRNAPQAAKAFGQMIRSLSPKQYAAITDDILNRANAVGATRAKLYIAGNKALNASEEAFSARFIEKIPGLKQWLGASSRTYETYLDSLRIGVFERYAKNLQKSGLTGEALDKAMADAANFINVASGRGSFGKTLDKAMEPLGAVLFAPRYTASRFNILNPATYLRMSGPARKEAIKDLVGFVSVISATLGLARAAGASVDLDPRSTDFGKIRIGNRRYDLGAGLIQPIRTIARIADDLYSAKGGRTPHIAGRFVRSKLSPVASLLYDYGARRDYTGKPFELDKALIDRTVPLFEKDLIDAIRDEGVKGGLLTLPAGLGVGVQNFGAPQTRRRRRP